MTLLQVVNTLLRLTLNKPYYPTIFSLPFEILKFNCLNGFVCHSHAHLYKQTKRIFVNEETHDFQILLLTLFK